MKILVADENKKNCRSLKTLLKGNGYDVICVANGAEALDKLRSQKFGLIISDITMPAMDGFQLCRECKQDKKLKAIPFIFYTADYADTKDEKFALKLGANKFIRKPVEPAEFIKQIQAVLKTSKKSKSQKIEPAVLRNKEVLELYNERLVENLEHKLEELEKANAEMKQANLVLTENSNKFQMLYENSYDAILLTIPDGRILAANDAACRMFGMTEKEICRVGRSGIIDINDPLLDNALKKRQRTGEYKADLTYIRRDGTRFVGETSSKIYINTDGNMRTTMIIRDITERKLAEEAVSQERDRAQTYLDIAGVIIVAIDAEGEITLVNRRGCEILGYETNEIIGKNWFTTFLPERVRKDVLTVWNRILLGEIEPLRQYENEVLTRDGTERTIAWVNVDLRDENGKIIGTLSSGTDITERKRAEEKLRESRERFRELSDLLPQGIWETDEKGIVTYANAASRKMRDYTPQDGPQSYIQLTALEDRERISKDFMALMRGEPINGNEYKMQLKDGKFFPALIYASPIVRDGKNIGARGITVNITEQKQIEERLRESRARFRELADLLPQGVWEANEKGTLIYTNAKLKEMYGYPADAPEAMLSVGANTTEDRTRLLKNFQRVLKGETLDGIEYTAQARDGKSFPIMVYASPITHENKIVGVRGVTIDITEQKQAEQALKKSEERFRRLAENVPDIIYRATLLPAYHFEYISPAVTGITGYTPEEYYANPELVTLQVHPEDKTLQQSMVDKPELYRQTPVLMRYLRKDGNTIWVERRQIPVYDNTGILVGIEGIIRDVSEDVRMREALQMSETKYRDLYKNAPVAYFSVGTDGLVRESNRAAQLLFGYSEEELLGIDRLELYVPEFETKAIALFETVKGGIPIEDEEMLFKRKDKSRVYGLLSITPVLDDQGKMVTARSVVKDITERKKAEEALRESEAKYRLIAETTPDNIVQMDALGNIVFVSPTFNPLLGISPAEAIGMNFSTFIPPSSLSWAQSLLSEVAQGKILQNIEIELMARNGTIVPVETNVAPVLVNNKVVGILCIARDITERKKMEEEKKRLEEKAQINSRLAAVGEMAAGIAHEINNPLTGVIGFSQMLLEKEDIPEDIKDNLELIADGSQRVADIVKRLLIFARQTKPVRTSVNLNDLIDNTVKLRNYVLKTANIEVITRFDPDLPWSVVDPSQLQQVFLNIIVNAEHSMKKAHGRGVLTITTEKKKGNIRISFHDDGTGISKENIGRLFEPFFTTKEPGEGTGLGLSLSRSIILEHDGEMYVESEFGKGATFIIEVPITEAPPTETDDSSSLVKTKTIMVKTGRILVVDDESGVRELVSKTLTRAGHSVDSTSDAREAITKIDSGATFDVIITDIRMPGISGIELYAHILKKTPSMAKKTIFITGDVMGVDIRTFLTQNNLPYLSKPFNIEILKEKVDTILESIQQDNASQS